MKWLKTLIGSAHSPGLKRAMRLFYKIERMLKDKIISKAEAKRLLDDVVDIALGSSFEYALRLLPSPVWKIEKKAALSYISPYSIYPDTGVIDEKDKERVKDLVEKAIIYGSGASSVVDESARRYGDYLVGKSVVRTIILNEYTRGYLKQWKQGGLQHVKRVEMHDHKTCPLCRGLNGNVYRIDDLLREEYPLTYCTHPNCRGTYSPYLGTLTSAKPLKPVFRVLKNNGNEAVRVAPEYSPWLSILFRRVKLPYKIECVYKKEEPWLTKRMGEWLFVNIPNVGDRDIREVVLEPWAKEMWKKDKDKFMRGYEPLVRAGIVHPQRQVTEPKDIFIDGFISYILKQLDEPFEIWWWGQYFLDRHIHIKY